MNSCDRKYMAMRSKGFSIWPITESVYYPVFCTAGRAWPSSDAHLSTAVLGWAESKQELAIEQRIGIPKGKHFYLMTD